MFISSTSSGIIVVQCAFVGVGTSASQVQRAVGIGSVGVGRGGIDAASVGSTVRGCVESARVGVGRGSNHRRGRTVGGQELRLATGNGQQGEQAQSELVRKVG